MAYDLTPLRSYVRFYQSVKKQLSAASEALLLTHQAARETLLPFADALKPVASKALAAAVAEPPEPPAALGALWQPEDEENLAALTDVYEVVGRFSFQGVDDENLKRVQALVAAERNEALVQRKRLTELLGLKQAALGCAERLAAEEASKAATDKSQRLAAFAPLAEAVRVRARQTIAAVREVPVPVLEDITTATDEYRAYASKADSVYQTCLPFLRRAINELYDFAGCESPVSWPDKLPIHPELPPDLVIRPAADSPELQDARASLEALGKEEDALGEAQDELSATVARLREELQSFQQKDGQVVKEIEQATMLVSFGKALAEVETTKKALVSFANQKAQRTQARGEIWQRHSQTQAAITSLEQELANRAAAIKEAEARLAEEIDAEPALFGKDDWRGRVQELEREVEGLRNTFGQRQGLLNKLRIELSSLGVQAQTEQSQLALIDGWIADANSKLEAQKAECVALDERLGADRPVHSPTVAEAETVLSAAQTVRAEIAERMERLKTNVRRNEEENTLIVARRKKIEDARKKIAGIEQSAKVAATQGHEEALRQLAVRRRMAVQQHVTEVIGELEKSLNSVDEVFIEPAKKAMFGRDEPSVSAAAVVRENAVKIAPIIESLARELEPQLVAQDEVLDEIQKKFCDVSSQACREAWL